MKFPWEHCIDGKGLIFSSDSIVVGQDFRIDAGARVRCMRYHQGLLALVTDNKQLLVYKGGELLCSKPLVKKGNCILFAQDGILVGDKFGDVYRFKWANNQLEDARLLLGHVSILTAMVLGLI